MTPHRRQVLGALGTTGVAALAGCPSVAGNGPTKLAPADGDSRDYFGSSGAVATDGGTAIVAAHRDDDPNDSLAGAVYVFEQSGGRGHSRQNLRPRTATRPTYSAGQWR